MSNSMEPILGHMAILSKRISFGLVTPAIRRLVWDALGDYRVLAAIRHEIRHIIIPEEF